MVAGENLNDSNEELPKFRLSISPSEKEGVQKR